MKKILSKSMSWILSIVMLLGGVFGILPQITDSLTASAASVSEKESNDSMATAQAITIGNTINATLSENDYQNYFKVTLTTSGRLSFDITSYMPVLNFILYDEDANELYKRWEKYYSDGSYNNPGNSFQWNSVSQKVSESLSWDLTAGTYYFRFQFRKIDLNTGSYNFTTKFTSANETYKESGWGNNNTMQMASAAAFDKHYIGQIARNDEYDFYKVTLPSSGRFSAFVTGSIEYLNCRLYNEDGDSLIQYWEKYYSDGSYNNSGSSFHWNDVSKKLENFFSIDLTKGIYYICLKRNGGSVYCTGNYDIMFSFESANESFTETGWGINNTMADASKAELNTNYTGQIARNDDYDYYQIVMPKSGTLNTNVKGRLPYLNYRLYDESGNIKESRWEKYYSDGSYNNSGNSFHWNDTSKTFDETVSTELEAGTYYICLKKNGGDTYCTGTYDISFNSDVVVSPTSITLNKTSATIEQGKSLTLTATVAPTNATNKTVTWTSSNTSVATVSGGVVKGVATGTATITAKTANGKTATCKVTVTEQTVEVTGITLSKTSATIEKGKSLTLTATVAPTNATNQTVTWTSSNTSVATVSGGVVKGVATGTATITAKTVNGKTAKCKITVTDPAKELKLNDNLLSSSSVKLGESVTVSAGASGGTAPYLFAVYYKKSVDTKWTTEQNYSKNTTIQIKPAEVSDYDVCVKVKDSTGKIVKNNFTFKVFEELKNTTEISSLDIGYGDKITVKAKATGGVGNYTYAVYYKKTSETKWTTVQNYSSKTSITIKPKYAGEYDISVKAKDGSGTIVKKSFKVKVTKPTNTSKVSSTTINLGDTIKIKCSATGSSGFYKYAVYYKKASDTAWKTKQDYAPNYDVTFKPASKTKYNLCVKIIDNFGNVAKKNFTITVK